jgi:PAS domain-containing protein
MRSVEALQLIASIADGLPCGVWVAMAPDGRFVYSNRAFEEIMGMGPVTDVGVGEYAVPYGIYGRDGALYPEHRLPFVRALQERKTVVVDDLVIQSRSRRAGAVTFCSSTTSPSSSRYSRACSRPSTT